jgi:hypothetical protein
VVGRDAEFEISGALLRRGHDIPSMVASLADRLERALPNHVVRGVCVRSEDVSIDDWFDRLAAALEAEATRSTQIRLALEEALG